MGLSALDIAILVIYFLGTLAVGLYLSKRASQSIDAYFLGGRKIPWWAIGMSGSASNFDMTGTMVIISFIFAIGMQGVWVSMRGGIGIPLGILMVFMGKWLRRSNVMTTAEWMKLRFGDGSQGRAARLLSAISNLVVLMAFLIYFVKGTGKFLSFFLPFEPFVCSILMIVVAISYTALSGFFGVIYTDIVQEILILGVAVFVGLKAFFLTNHSDVMNYAGSNWSSFLPRWEAEPMGWLDNPYIYQAFGLCIVFWIARGIFEGMGGFTGGYLSQRFYAARNDREASLLTAEWIVLLFFRWALIIGVAVLGLSVAMGNPQVANLLMDDPEMTLPTVLSTAIPNGIRGILVAGLVAAAMSTFDSTVNAGVSYWIRDIYQAHLKPKATKKQLMRQSYLATVILALLAVLLALSISNINEIWSWITGPLSAGLFAPVILRWYWWRFNGYGFAISTAVGLLVSLMFKIFAPDMAFYESFIWTWIASLAGGIAGSYLTPATPLPTLKRFWLRIRPFGLWSKIEKQLGETKVKWIRLENTIHVLNLFFAISWHLSGVASVIALILHKWTHFWTFAILFAFLTLILYFTWFRTLQSKEDAEIEAKEKIGVF